MSENKLSSVEEKIGYRFVRKELLESALTHASSTDSRMQSNERLEFLGDAVLGLVVCEELFRVFPDLLEGDLTKIKSTVVSRKTCARIIQQMRLDEELVLGKGMLNHDRAPSSVAAALLEALVGAIYLDAADAEGRDAGLAASRAFLMPLIDSVIRRAADSGHHQNFKSVLQHHAQENLSTTPMYVLLDEQGPDHAKCFEVCVQLGAERFESRWGQSKKDAEQKAALAALEAMGMIDRDEDGQVRIAEHAEHAEADEAV